MKQYGFNKTTEFTKKQINVIYGKAKCGQLKVEKWYMSNLYDLADYYGYDDNGTVEKEEVTILKILDYVFGGDIENAQILIEYEENRIYNLLGSKNQAKCNRELYV